MASSGSLFSQTLQDITNTKLNELALKREKFEQKHQSVVANVKSQQHVVGRLCKLVAGVKSSFSVSIVRGRVVVGGTNNRRLEIDLNNLDRFLAQATYDPSVSLNLLVQWERNMFRHLDVQSRRFTYADLFGKLTTEWLASRPASAAATNDADTEMEDFEHVAGGKKMESRLNWERLAFQAVEVDQDAVKSMLKGLFEPRKEGSKAMFEALKDLRDNTEEAERESTNPQAINADSLDWTVDGLLASDLLSDDKRNVLREFKGNSVIMGEIADVLSMRLAGLDSWSWGSEVPLEERRQLNGSYNIYMHEDILQAIFLQFIGVCWSVHWKKALSEFRRAKGVWKTQRGSIPLLDKQRREYYLGRDSKYPNVEAERQKLYRKDYFLASLLSRPRQKRDVEEGDEEADFEERHVQQQQQQSARPKQTAQKRSQVNALMVQAPRRQLASQAKRRRTIAVSEDSDEDFESDDEDEDRVKNPMEAKQTLLHLLSTDILVKCRLQGGMTCFRSQFADLYPSMPHATIGLILEYFGVSKKWLKFFETFLQAPLKFMDDKSSEPRLRRRGTPGAHVLSEVFGEVVLFCLDFMINQDTGGELLWRMGDDFWFWSKKSDVCVKAWSTINKFAKTVGLTTNENRSGSVQILQKADSEAKVVVDVGTSLPQGQIRWGMLQLNPASGRFEIDQSMVDKHIEELNRQLKGKRNSVFAWVQAWNSYATTFFTSNFGKAAHCYGRQHVDNMLTTHNRIQRKVFSSSTDAGGSDDHGNIVDYLRHTIKQRFNIQNIPDGYFFFPTELGGLEVRNPFINLLQIRDTVVRQPSSLLDAFFEAEKEAYRLAKARFDQGLTQQYETERRWGNFKPADSDSFFSFEEFVKYREELNYGFDKQLVNTFKKLLERPGEEPIENEDDGLVRQALNSLGRTNRSSTTIKASWHAMDSYWKWVAQLYGPEMIDSFGGLGIVDPGLLPMGMVSLFRAGRVKWQE